MNARIRCGRSVATCLSLALFLALAARGVHAQDFLRGDANGDALVNMADAMFSVNYQFLGGPQPGCEKALDTNDDGDVDIADPIYSLANQFGIGPAPSAPFPDCGEDPTGDTLTCDNAAACSLGGPIDGLDEAQIMAFNRGREVMFRRFTPEEGLGPFFNTTNCRNCHEDPVVGGSAPVYRNFFLVVVGEGLNQARPDNFPSRVLASYSPPGQPRLSIPAAGPNGEPVTASQRNAPPMFGTGLFEDISNGTIIALADPEDANSDGISGRFNTDGNGNLGRFGYKLQANFIEAFIRGATFNQMGITSDPVLGSGGIVNWRQISSDFDEPTIDNDGVPDPEVSVADFADLIAFCRFLRPPKKKPFGPDETAGETIFANLNCTGCHVPSLPSARGPVEAYTDLLLHDMGPELADGLHFGMPQTSPNSPVTTESEFRTQPLWGVSNTAPYLHDGRAATLHDAIAAHGGEAAAIRDAYMALSQSDKDLVIKFLEAL